MTREIGLSLMLLVAPALGGCAVQAALAATELVQYLPRTEQPSNAHLAPAATRACTERAGQYGSAYVTNVEQRRPDLIIVWGAVTDNQQRRRTFECRFTSAVASFRLRDIP